LMHTQGSMNDFREVLNSNRMVVRNVPVYERNPLWTDDGRNGDGLISAFDLLTRRRIEFSFFVLTHNLADFLG